MQISKEQPMRPALDDVIDAVNDIGDIGPYVTDAVDDWLDEHPEATATVQDDSLTTAKYQDGSVTSAKLATDAVTTEKIADGAVTDGKLHEPDLLMVGGAESVTNDAAITSEYLYAPVPDGIGNGLALIESICGNTIVESGSLLPVRMEGVETVGFNQWDEQWEVGEIADATGQNSSAGGRIRAKNYIPCFANTSYYLQSSLSTNDLRLYYYDADKGYIGHTGWLTNGIITTPSGCRYMRFATGGAYGATYNNDICINISDPSRNGTYEPYWSSQRTIPVATYFSNGLRSAGSVADELTETQAITRVGAVDLGSLTWAVTGTNTSGVYRLIATLDGLKPAGANSRKGNVQCAPYDTITADGTYTTSTGIAVDGTLSRLVVYDPSYNTSDSVADFKAAMSGVILYYELATPTTTPIDPALPLTYRVGADGTERVMVASGTQSALPIFATRYPVNLADLAESIAPRESTIATGNHAIGDLIMLGWTLCKATQVIVTGETIEIGTNVTKTTVAAEIAALS